MRRAESHGSSSRSETYKTGKKEKRQFMEALEPTWGLRWLSQLSGPDPSRETNNVDITLCSQYANTVSSTKGWAENSSCSESPRKLSRQPKVLPVGLIWSRIMKERQRENFLKLHPTFYVFIQSSLYRTFPFMQLRFLFRSFWQLFNIVK